MVFILIILLDIIGFLTNTQKNIMYYDHISPKGELEYNIKLIVISYMIFQYHKKQKNVEL